MTRTSQRRSGGGRTVRKAQKSNTPLIIGGVVAALVIIGAIAFALTRSSGQVGEPVPDSGASLHLQNPNDPLPVPFNSDPPTSGYHWGGGVGPWGVSTRPISDTITVHNLEHGGVMIHYRSDLDAATVEKLADLTRDLQRQNPCIILAPRDSMTQPITATAWNYILRLDGFDEGKLRSFYTQRVGRGPELVCRRLS
jgi:hypothetical protein